MPRRKIIGGVNNESDTATQKTDGGKRESRVDSGSVDLETPSLDELSPNPKSPLEVMDEAISSVLRPIAPPRTVKNNSTSR